MRSVMVVFLVLVSCGGREAAPRESSSPAPAAPEALRIQRTAPTVGERIDHTTRFSLELEIQSASGPLALVGSGEWQTEETVTAVENGIVTGREVRFGSFRAKLPGTTDQPDLAAALAGRGFHLKWEDQRIAYSSPDGELSEAEREALALYDRHDTGRLAKSVRLLTDREYVVGHAWQAPAGEAIFGGPAKSLSITLESFDDLTATFRVRQISKHIQNDEALVEFRGTIIMERATGRVRESDSFADLIEPSDQVLAVKIAGRETYAYSRP